MNEHKTVRYACGHEVLVRQNEVIPAKCPECGALMYDNE